MTELWLKIELLSDATFGRGDGVAGLVDAEVQHDEYGLPFLGGKTLKGLLGAECAEILFSLKKIFSTGSPSPLEKWHRAAGFLFGIPTSGVDEIAKMYVGDARLPEDLRRGIAWQFQQVGKPQQAALRQSLLDALTAMRQQTAMDAESGAPKAETLRTMRVIRRDTPFEACLRFIEAPDDVALGLLATCVKSLRRAGTGRNRGRGKIKVDLYDKNPSEIGAITMTTDYFLKFVREAGL
jgi:hypothetical protein